MTNQTPTPSPTFIGGGSFSELEQRLLDDVATLRQTDPLTPIVIATGSRLLAEHLRWQLNRRLAGCFNIHIITLAELSRRLSFPGSAADAKPVLPSSGAGVAVKAALAGLKAKHYYSEIADRPGFARALANCFNDLDEAGLEDFTDLAARLDDRTRRLKALADLRRGYNRLLKKFSRNLDSYAQAASPDKGITPSQNYHRCFQTDTLCVYGFYDWTELQWRLLERLSAGIAIRCYAPRVQPEDEYGSAFSYAARAAQRWRQFSGADGLPEASSADRPDLSGRLFRYDPALHQQPFTPESLTISIIEGYDIREELGELTGKINELALWQGVPFADIGIIVWQPERYRRRLIRTLEEAGFPVADTIGDDLSSSPAAASLLALLNLIGEKVERAALVDCLASYRLLLAEETTGGESREEAPDPVAWETASLKLGMVDGTSEDWLRELDDLIKRRESVDQSDENLRRTIAAAQLKLFRAFLARLFAHFAGFPPQAKFSRFTKATLKLMTAFIPETAERTRAAEVISGLAALDEVRNPISRDEFIGVVQETVAASPRPATRGRLRRDGITICDRMSARGLAFRALFLPGFSAGEVPTAPREDPLLSDADRRRINLHVSGDELRPLPLKSRRSDEERLLFGLAVDAAGEYLTLSYVTVDEKGNSRLPSPFVMELCRALEGKPISADQLRESRHFRVAVAPPSKSQVARRSVDSHGYVLNKLAADGATQSWKEALRRVYRDHPAVRRFLECTTARTSGSSFSRWDGMMPDAFQAQTDVNEPAFSATQLETYVNCPFKYLMKHRLGLEPWEEPTRRLELPAMEIGSLVHRVLQRLLPDISPSRDSPPLALTQAKERLRQILDGELQTAQRRFPLPEIIWRLERDALLTRLENYLEYEYKAASEFRFLQAEKDFKQRISFTGGGGTTSFRLAGRIDRMDVAPEGDALRLIDYKTGKPRLKDDSWSQGEGLQSPLYLKAALSENQDYEIARSRAEYVHILPGGDVKVITFSGETLQTKETGLAELMAALTSAIAAGCFPPQPEARKCSECDYQRACDRRSRTAAAWRSDLRLMHLQQALEQE